MPASAGRLAPLAKTTIKSFSKNYRRLRPRPPTHLLPWTHLDYCGWLELIKILASLSGVTCDPIPPLNAGAPGYRGAEDCFEAGVSVGSRVRSR